MEQDLSLLFKKLLNNECSPDELNEVLDRLLNRERGYGYQLIQEHLNQQQDISAEAHERLDRKLKQVQSNDYPEATRTLRYKIFSLVQFAATACIILFLLAQVYLHFINR